MSMPRSTPKESVNAPDAGGPGAFSQRMNRARHWVEQMERQTEDLDQAMEAYRQAMEDLEWCREYLRKARLQVEALVKSPD